ncbi:HpcH/HpaI aldolase/citrate lyase family protein [Bordetella genomosp. 13]|uniref:HpcH/HpaI aldolase/citrate lyase family protein n=1 Tax=Bordetella genomosp. 13 TaxID=463040 RepID=UPI0011A0AE82|nr:CoA ester lyase [Bordetella genomosp. 13]
MQMNELRSLLFLPADAPAFLARAHERGADAVIVDLEDSILPERKDAARQVAGDAARSLAARGLRVLLRVNADPEAWRADLGSVDLRDLRAVMLPKVESATQVAALAQALDAQDARAGIAALVESPLGVVRATEIAQASPRLCALGFGAEDYAAAMSIAPEPENLRSAAQYVALNARAFGLAGWGLADSIANLTDMARFEAAVREARNLGFTGSVAIHPKQVPLVNRGFSPTEADLEWARRVLAAAEAGRQQGKGVVLLDGRMIDQPLVDRANRWMRQGRSAPAG